MSVRIACIALLAIAFAGTTARAQVSPESAEKYEAGQELFQKRRYQEALKSFEEAVKLDGNNAQAYRAMGRTYQELRNYDKAVEAYGKATQIKADYAAAYYELGQVNYQYLRKYADAQRNFQKVLEIDEELDGGKARDFLYASYLKQGNFYFRQRNYKQAAEQYENATQIDPSSASTFYNLGLAWKGAREYRRAEEAFSTATDLDSKYAKAFKALGDLYKDTRRDSEAAGEYSKAIDADPKYIDAYLNLAVVYIGMKQPDKAVGVLKKALTVEPGNSEVLGALGYAYAQNKDFKSAINTYQKALQANGNDPEVFYRLATAYLETQQYREAINTAQKAIGTKFSVPAHVIMGDAYEAMKSDGWKEKAIQHYEAGLKDRRYQKYCEDKIDRIKNPMGGADAATAQDDGGQ